MAARVGATVAGLGLLKLLLWAVRPDWPGLVPLGGAPAKPATAFAFALLGLVLARPDLPRLSRHGLLAMAASVGVDGLLAAAAGRGLLFGGLLFPSGTGPSGGDGRIAVGTAVALVLLSLSLALLRPRPWVATGCALAAFAIGYLALLGHLYGVDPLHTMQSATAMAASTAVGLVVLAPAVLLSDRRLPVSRLVHTPGTPGAVARGLLPWAFLLPPVLGWLGLRGELAGLIDARYVVALMVLAMVTGLLAVVLLSARTAAHIDRDREEALAQLEALNAELADRVTAAVAEVEHGRQRLETVLERTPVGIFETAPDGRRRYANRRWRELAGVAEGDDLDRHWLEVVHPQDRARVHERWVRALLNGREFTERYRYLRPDGSQVWVDVTTVAMRGPDGAVTHWLGSVADVTEQVRVAERLAASEQRYRSVVSSMAEGVILQDASGRIVTANDAACQLLGMPREELVGRSTFDPEWAVVDEDGTPLSGDLFPSVIAQRTGRSVRDVTVLMRRSDGSRMWLRVNSEPLLDNPADGREPTGVVITFADVTENREAAAAVRRSEEQFRTAMRHAPIGMALVELDGRFREVNAALCRIVGYSEAELLRRTFQDITHPEDLAADLHNVERLLTGELDHYAMEKRYLTERGDLVWVLLSVSCARDGEGAPAYFVAQIQDVTDARLRTEALTHRATHDPLTGLPNRERLTDHLAEALRRGVRGPGAVAVMFLDLDGFKQVNDTWGHDAGDELLREIAGRLRLVVRPGDVVARLGGDEFVVVAERMPDLSAAAALAERVRAVVAEPVALPGGTAPATVRVGASIGVALAHSEDDARAVLRRADSAMYRAKALGRDRVEVAGRPAGQQDGWGLPAVPRVRTHH